jgi:hypothetical protein
MTIPVLACGERSGPEIKPSFAAVFRSETVFRQDLAIRLTSVSGHTARPR